MAYMETHSKLEFSENRFGELDCVVLAPPTGAQPARFCVILCHGFGAPGTDLAALGPDLATMCPEHAADVAYIFPQGPMDLGTYGLPGARAWWMIDIERFQRSMGDPEKMARFQRGIPEGMPESSQLMQELVSEVHRRLKIPPARMILGGFSQGSMVTTDVALRLSERPAGLCVYSGSLIAEEEWTSLAQKRGPLPVLQSHGTFDPILPYAGAEALRKLLQGAGLEVEFLRFEGPHTIPFGALERLALMMRRVFIDQT
jgi:phospholipase/carboxylesterase